MQEVKQHRRKIEEQSLKNSVLDNAAAARFSTAAALEAAREKGIAGEGCSPTTVPCLLCRRLPACSARLLTLQRLTSSRTHIACCEGWSAHRVPCKRADCAAQLCKIMQQAAGRLRMEAFDWQGGRQVLVLFLATGEPTVIGQPRTSCRDH